MVNLIPMDELRANVDNSENHAEWANWAREYSRRAASSTNANDAEDAAQNTFLALSRESKEFTLPGSDCDYWFPLINAGSEKIYAARAKHVQLVTRNVLSDSYLQKSRQRSREQKAAIRNELARSRTVSSNLRDLHTLAEIAACVESLPTLFKECCERDTYGEPRSEKQAAEQDETSKLSIRYRRRTYRALIGKCLQTKRLTIGQGGVP